MKEWLTSLRKLALVKLLSDGIEMEMALQESMAHAPIKIKCIMISLYYICCIAFIPMDFF